MHVVSARVHHGDIVAVTVDSANCTGVRKTGRLGHGQRVHVCAEQDGRALPVAQYPDHTGATDAFVHLVSAITKAVGDFPGGPVFLMRQFRVRV